MSDGKEIGVVMWEGFGTLYRRKWRFRHTIHTHGLDVEEWCIIHNDCSFFFWTNFKCAFTYTRHCSRGHA